MEALTVMLTLRFDYVIILVFSSGIWSAFLATPILALLLESPNRAAYRIAILVVEGTTMILWFVCFTMLVEVSYPLHCDLHSCVASRVITLFGVIEGYATPTMARTPICTLAAKSTSQLLMHMLLGYCSWPQPHVALQFSYKMLVDLSKALTPAKQVAHNNSGPDKFEYACLPLLYFIAGMTL